MLSKVRSQESTSETYSFLLLLLFRNLTFFSLTRIIMNLPRIIRNGSRIFHELFFMMKNGGTFIQSPRKSFEKSLKIFVRPNFWDKILFVHGDAEQWFYKITDFANRIFGLSKGDQWSLLRRPLERNPRTHCPYKSLTEI